MPELTRSEWKMPRRKVIGVPLQKDMQKGEDGSLFIRGYFTSDNTDEIGDIITRGATERALPKYREWGNIRYMHLPKPVAKVVRIGSQDGLDWNEVEIKVIDPQAAFEVENGLLQALSVGILVNFDDVEMQESGGWVINDYQLAEISLVDHPANYDAKLKDLHASEQVQMFAREYGLDALARSMEALKDISATEEISDEQTDAVDISPEEEGVVETVMETEKELSAESVQEDTAVEAVEETPVVEEQETITIAESLPEGTVEAVISEMEEAPAEELPVTIENTITEESEAEAPLAEVVMRESITEAEPDVLPEPADFVALVNANAELLEAVKTLTQEVSELRKALEASEEAPQAEVQSESGEVLDKGIDEEEEEIPGPAVNRVGAIPETVLPTETPDEEQPQRSKDLKEALHKYFNRE